MTLQKVFKTVPALQALLLDYEIRNKFAVLNKECRAISDDSVYWRNRLQKVAPKIDTPLCFPAKNVLLGVKSFLSGDFPHNQTYTYQEQFREQWRQSGYLVPLSRKKPPLHFLFMAEGAYKSKIKLGLIGASLVLSVSFGCLLGLTCGLFPAIVAGIAAMVVCTALTELFHIKTLWPFVPVDNIRFYFPKAPDGEIEEFRQALLASRAPPVVAEEHDA